MREYIRESILERLAAGPVMYADLAESRNRDCRARFGQVFNSLRADGLIKKVWIGQYPHWALASGVDENEVLIRRIEENSRQDSEGCINWLGYVDPRRGPMIRVDQKPQSIRRLLWAMNGREVDYQTTIRCSCENEACINLKHLKKGSRKDKAIGRKYSIVHRKKLADAQRANGKAKLTMEQAREVRASAETNRTLAVRFGVSEALISGIRRDKSYKEFHAGLFPGQQPANNPHQQVAA
ncbi:hypothetical protein [Curvibacter lanceolatus]|uniref:hypothetical protein n=1 Tax=Curvibacter lanceolatus TaxID=86182 RepID=UPI000364AE6A|nr:hypothetical protein [Curvibacter lanceolatus]